MNEFTRENLRELRPQLDEALRTVGEKYGVQFRLGNIRFETKMFTVKLDGMIGGNTEDAERSAFERDTRYGAPALKGRFGMEFNYFGHTYQISGYRARRKNPVLCRRVDNQKLYQLPYRVIEQAFSIVGAGNG